MAWYWLMQDQCPAPTLNWQTWRELATARKYPSRISFGLLHPPPPPPNLHMLCESDLSMVSLSVCVCLYPGAVPAALLPDWLTQTSASRKWHQRGPLSAHVARLSVMLDTRVHAHTDKHPSLFPNSLTRKIAPCLTIHPLPGRVRFMSCPGFYFKGAASCPIRRPPPLPLAFSTKIEASRLDTDYSGSPLLPGWGQAGVSSLPGSPACSR